jgi:hypothetical protein
MVEIVDTQCTKQYADVWPMIVIVDTQRDVTICGCVAYDRNRRHAA